MTRATRKKDVTEQPAAAVRADVLTQFADLVATAGVSSEAPALFADGVGEDRLNAALSEELRLAHDRWGLGLLHLRHAAELRRPEGGLEIALLVDGAERARVSEGPQTVAATYAVMTAPGADGLSEWGVLPDGHRVTLRPGLGQLRVLVEDARDFETHWTQERGGLWTRTWRQGETLAVEVHRPASPTTALADAAWDVIASVKDRTFQRELMERSNSVGMLGALLGARHAGASGALALLPEAHFAVSSAVLRAQGAEGRSLDRWKALLREGAEQLDELQRAGTKRLAAVLSGGLR
ncbi:DNA repair protein [Deinococcus sp. MIMF12]|uniref:DNA repair protein n=1 Tax=Deinococcus rhizophilus TaxID=3049544 RepID=A0ABT7JIA5_9DEIO|nr:DNA repair protein [Deinococcus rhizophilus]MDL2344796.1 DNA repair protein [Deinococcus rhizophilus]